MRELGVALARAGLTERAMKTCFGISHASQLRWVLPERRDPGPRPPRASVPLWLFCAGRAIDRDHARAALELDRLVEAGLVIDDGGPTVRATCMLLPIGSSIAVCDREDDPSASVLWPDDSTHHLIASLPSSRAARWLDVGTGACVAPLAAPGRAREIRATDVSPHAIDRARAGLALSGVTHVEAAVADLADGAGPGWDLVTFNAPIPAETGIPRAGDSLHRRAPPGAAVLERFWAQAPSLVTDTGEVIVHSYVGEDPLAALAHLPGAIGVFRYSTDRRFAITVWRPSGICREVVDVLLVEDQPHVARPVIDRLLGA
ncbi:MAG TPA: methyltransferase [Kofleriaceae bacterium]|jgi:methylase of polypeptide subunit release factors|nr:methyltransferase [Kofleriaceae bacterium]